MKIYFRKKKQVSVNFLVIGLSATLIFTKLSLAFTEENKKAPIEQPAEAKDLLTGQTQEQKLFILRKLNFINSAVTRTTSTLASTDSELTFELQTQRPLLYLTKEELHKIHPQGPDPFGQELRRKLTDTPPTLPLFTTHFLGLPDAVEKAPMATFIPDFSIPGDTEIDVLKVLWQQPGSTSSEIYAQLDTTTRVTAEDLQTVLESMSNRGLLVRKKISPSNKFSLFGIVSFELSSLNRKNKLYIYWPIVPKGRLITYVDSQRYLALASSKSNVRKYSYQKYLEEKLYRLVK